LDADDSRGATGANYATTYIATGPGVAIADSDVSIADIDSGMIHSACVRLTEVMAGDMLSVKETLPGGISARALNPASGELTLSGEASLSAYQAALHQVVFSNTDEYPSTADRAVSVVVNDGGADSNAASTTVHVTILPTMHMVLYGYDMENLPAN